MQGVKSAVNWGWGGSIRVSATTLIAFLSCWALGFIFYRRWKLLFWLKTFSGGKGECSDYRLLRRLLSQRNICSCQKWLSVLLGVQTFLTDPPLSLVNKFKSDSGRCLCVRLPCAHDLCTHSKQLDSQSAIPDPCQSTLEAWALRLKVPEF